MQKRRLGKLDMDVSVLGLGTVKFGRNQGVRYPAAFELPSDEALQLLLATAKELGINLLDTAPAYGSSEERLGKLLQYSRHEWIVSSKVGEEFINGQSQFDFSPRAIQASVERSLQRLNTDYLDILLVHSNGDDVRLIEEENVFVSLDALKQAGKIRGYGMSTKTVVGGLLTLTHADLAMVTFNPLEQVERAVIAAAYAQQKGIFIKKALVSGHLQPLNSPQALAEALAFSVNEPGVSSVIIGTINAVHLRENCQVLS